MKAFYLQISFASAKFLFYVVNSKYQVIIYSYGNLIYNKESNIYKKVHKLILENDPRLYFEQRYF